jgi:hypothetical protein
MSWMRETRCPVCGGEGFDPDCDEVDVGVGTIEGNRRGRCPSCGEVAECPDCGVWCHENRTACACVIAASGASRTRFTVHQGAKVPTERARDCKCPERAAADQRQLMAYVDMWNRMNPIGCEVDVRRDNGDIEQTRTRSEAQLLGGHTPVVWLEGIVGCYALERVTRR